MLLREVLLPEFDHEMANTRKTMERVPEDRPDFRPHPKSMPLATLAAFVADLARWGELLLTQESLDIAPPGKPPYERLVMKSRQQILDVFDESVARGREALVSMNDAALLQTWTLQKGRQILLEAPRVVALRTMILNHLVHHRAQLGVYLRMNEIPVPALYGPSADEQQTFQEAFAR